MTARKPTLAGWVIGQLPRTSSMDLQAAATRAVHNPQALYFTSHDYSRCTTIEVELAITSEMTFAWWDAFVQAWVNTPASVLAVMAAGILAGSIAKSITGFGSTIAHLCIWSVVRAAGVNVGTLQQAIVTEVVFRTVTAVPYLHMTNARHTANLKLVVSISLFQTVGSPLGAWLLLILDQHILELCIAGALFLVLLGQAVTALLQRYKAAQQPSPKQQAIAPSGSQGLDQPLLVSEPPAPQWKGYAPSVSPDASTMSSESDTEADHIVIVPASDSTSYYSAQSGRPGLLQGPGDWHQWVVLLGAGSVAGTLSGVMGGLTGIDGPPTIFMFNVLSADKATVRGTNAVINCVLMPVLLIAYGAGGAFAWQDIPLYVTGSVFGWVGTVWGNTLSHKMSQLTFARVLNLMIVVCAGLMLVSGLGLAGF